MTAFVFILRKPLCNRWKIWARLPRMLVVQQIQIQVISLHWKLKLPCFEKLISWMLRSESKRMSCLWSWSFCYKLLFQKIETWKTLNEVINKRKTRSKMPSLFIYKDKQITDPLETANRFCEYFTNVGPSLANKLPDSGISHDLLQRIFCIIVENYVFPAKVIATACPSLL